MARRLSAEWRAEWRERLMRFRGWTGTSGDFCWHEGICRASLSVWAWRWRVPVAVRSRPGTGPVRVRAKAEAKRPLFATVRIRPMPPTDANLGARLRHNSDRGQRALCHRTTLPTYHWDPRIWPSCYATQSGLLSVPNDTPSAIVPRYPSIGYDLWIRGTPGCSTRDPGRAG